MAFRERPSQAGPRPTLEIREDQPLDRYRLAGRAVREALGRQRRVWIATGIHPEEVAALATAFIRLEGRHPGMLLVIAPERLGQCSTIYARLRIEGGLQVRRHSDGHGCDAGTQIYLLDTPGELRAFQAAADAAFIGSSFVTAGVADPTGPAMAGVPMVMGPFPEADDGVHDPRIQARVQRLVQSGGLRRACDPLELSAALDGLLVDGQLSRALGECARRALEASSPASAPALQGTTGDRALHQRGLGSAAPFPVNWRDTHPNVVLQ